MEDIDDGKSCVSALTNKTNKSKSGKTLDKHCPQCSFKLIKGSNWSRHCKYVQKGVIVQGKKCEIDCLCPKGKSQKITKSASLVAESLRFVGGQSASLARFVGGQKFFEYFRCLILSFR